MFERLGSLFSFLGNGTDNNFVSIDSIDSIAPCSFDSGVNPANGLPMVGGVDIEGNAFGCSGTSWDDIGLSGTDSGSFSDDW